MTATSKIILEKQKTVPEGISAVKIPCFAEGIPIPTVIRISKKDRQHNGQKNKQLSTRNHTED
jgi:hypothetical protein